MSDIGLHYPQLKRFFFLMARLTIYSSIEELGVISGENVLMKVHHDGRVAWEPPMMYIVHCEVRSIYLLCLRMSVLKDRYIQGGGEKLAHKNVKMHRGHRSDRI